MKYEVTARNMRPVDPSSWQRTNKRDAFRLARSLAEQTGAATVYFCDDEAGTPLARWVKTVTGRVVRVNPAM